MTSPQPTAHDLSPSFRRMLPSLIIDGLCPFLTYELLTAYVPGISQVAALSIGAIFPAINGIIGIRRSRHWTSSGRLC
jgi:hypothetical protein